MKKIIILTVCVILIVIVAIVIYNSGPPGGGDVGNSGNQIIVTNIASKYGIASTEKGTTVGKVVISGAIPLFYDIISEDDNDRSLSNLDFADDINNQILKLFNNYSDEIKLFKDGVSFDDDKNDLIKNKQYRYRISYDRHNNGGIISLVINMNYNTSGLRSNAWKETFNIDVVNCKQLSLSDLFSSSAYKEKIVSEINKQAKERAYDLIEKDGIRTIPDNQKFYIKDEKLVIYFENSAISKKELEFIMPFEFNDTTNKFSL